IWDKLESFFKRKVDLLTNLNSRNPYLKQSVDESKVLIYLPNLKAEVQHKLAL
ncbi:hypothetical protein LDC_0925, partial [sediment metagenome]